MAKRNRKEHIKGIKMRKTRVKPHYRKTKKGKVKVKGHSKKAPTRKRKMAFKVMPLDGVVIESFPIEVIGKNKESQIVDVDAVANFDIAFSEHLGRPKPTFEKKPDIIFKVDDKHGRNLNLKSPEQKKEFRDAFEMAEKAKFAKNEDMFFFDQFDGMYEEDLINSMKDNKEFKKIIEPTVGFEVKKVKKIR